MYKPYDTHLLAPTRSEQIRVLNDAFRTTPFPSVPPSGRTSWSSPAASPIEAMPSSTEP
jgi:hypothetical protein